MSCSTGCFEATIQNCSDIIIKAAFPANYSLYWIIQKSGMTNIYQKLVVTNSNGDLTIAKADLPPGYLTTGSFYKIQVKDGANYLQPIQFVFGGANYSCIQAQLLKYDVAPGDVSGINIIQFTNSIVLNGGGNVYFQLVKYKATVGQQIFSTPAVYTNIADIFVWRNGVFIEVTAVTNTTIQLPVMCDEDDSILIKQLLN